jgi:ABC-2 type transport system permease protein
VEETTYPNIRIPIIDYSIPLSFLPPKKETIAMSSVVNPAMYLPGLVNLFCLGFCMSGFAAFCSALDRYRWRTLGVVSAFYFSNAGLKMLGMGSEKFAWAENLSLFGLYHPANAIERTQVDPMSPFWILSYTSEGEINGLGVLSNCLLLILIGLAFYWIGMRVFVKRDLPAPM